MPRPRRLPALRLAVALASAALLALPGVAASQPAGPASPPPEPSAEQGRDLAQRYCSACHLVEGAGASAAQVGTPSLRAMANVPDQTASRIAGVLIRPHAAMPDLQLSRQQIQDLVAYLDTLRTDRTRPLLPPPAGAKPKLPSPS